MNIDPNTPIWQLTVGQLQELLSSSATDETKSDVVVEPKIERRLVYGLSGLATLLNCSKRWASEIKNSGRIDDAIIQDGRKPIFDRDKVIDLLESSKIY